MEEIVPAFDEIALQAAIAVQLAEKTLNLPKVEDRKSTRLNSSH